jgi:hypothetical protein
MTVLGFFWLHDTGVNLDKIQYKEVIVCWGMPFAFRLTTSLREKYFSLSHPYDYCSSDREILFLLVIVPDFAESDGEAERRSFTSSIVMQEVPSRSSKGTLYTQMTFKRYDLPLPARTHERFVWHDRQRSLTCDSSADAFLRFSICLRQGVLDRV